MNDENGIMVIHVVHENSVPYDHAHPKDFSTSYKEKTWNEIANTSNGRFDSGETCRDRWNQMRDQWRTTNKQKTTEMEIKKWRYEKELSSIQPFLRLRDTNVNRDDIAIKSEELELQENIPHNTEENTEINIIDHSSEVMFRSAIKRERLSANLDESPEGKKDESSSRALMKDFVEEKNNEGTSGSAEKDSTDLFFKTIAGKVARFTPYYKNIAESKIFNLVQELELKQILRINQQQPTTSRNYTVSSKVSSGHIHRLTSSPSTSSSTDEL
ncbi:hypothetical protein ABEB36_006725 [Hypothenemus hampei]|uniref:MADF domain-containing protein n=1 Tax=Hypothenemus hampei TaxID=57062 RepID=A0ABD1ESA9_HYPHA